MNNEPLFSVLIANHNDGRFIQDAIDSVLKQTYSRWEIIIVDDKSTDNSDEVYKKYSGDSRFHIYRNDNNEGCGYTKRRLAKLANGDICGFLDADDALAPKALQTMVDAHITHLECSLIYSQYYKTDSNLSIKEVSGHQCQIPSGKTFLDMPFSGAVSHFATFKTNLYHLTEGISPILKIAEDIDLYLKLEEVGQLLFIPKPLYYYRTDTGNNISLGKNVGKAMIWDIAARISACQRRKLDPSTFDTILSTIMDGQYHNGFYEGRMSAQKTIQYRIGATIVLPLKKLRHLFGKTNPKA